MKSITQYLVLRELFRPSCERIRRATRRLSARRPGNRFAHDVEKLEIRTLLTGTVDEPLVAIVDDDFAGLPAGINVEGGELGVDRFATIQRAVDAVEEGDIIQVRPGHYSESVSLTKSVSVYGITGDAADVVVTGDASQPAILVSGAATDVSIENLTVSGGTSNIRANGAEGASIQNVRLEASLGTGIRASGVGSLSFGDVTDHSAQGVIVTSSGVVTIGASDLPALTVTGTDSIAIGAETVSVQSPVLLEATDDVSIDGILNAGDSTVTVRANTDGVGTQGLMMASRSEIRTTDAGPNAILIGVNSLFGGTGTATLGQLYAGGGSTITVNSGRGAIRAAADAEVSVNSENVLLRGLGGVGLAHLPVGLNVDHVEGVGGNGGFHVSNQRALEVGGATHSTPAISAPGGSVSVSARGRLDLLEDVIGASVSLSTVDTTQGIEDIVIPGGITVRALDGTLNIESGDDVHIQGGALVESLTGPVNVEIDTGSLDEAGGVATFDGVVNSAVGTAVNGSYNRDRIVINTVGSGGLTLNGSSGDDLFEINYPSGGETFGSPVVVEEQGGGMDEVVINATEADDQIFVTTSQPETGVDNERVTRGTPETEPIIVTDRIELLTINLHGGADTAVVQPSILFPMHIDGGPPCEEGHDLAFAGDSLIFDPLMAQFVVEDRVLKTGNFDLTYADVSFSSFENLTAIPDGSSELQQFDFNHTNTSSSTVTSPTQAGFTGVDANTLYSQGLGYGWQEEVVSYERNDGFYSGPQKHLIQDGHTLSELATFTVDVARPGYYLVTLMIGNPYTDIRDISLRNEDTRTVFIDDLSTAAGESRSLSFPLLATDTTLDLTFINALNTPTIFGVNGLTVQSPDFLPLGVGVCENEPLLADGVSVELYPVLHAEPDTFLTVSTTLGTILNQDQDPEFQGIQILTDEAGQATIELQRPFGIGTAVISLHDVVNGGFGFGTVDFVPPSERHLDFNHFNRFSMAVPSPTMQPEASPTNPTGFIGVLGSDLYSPGSGFGWLNPQEGFDNGDFVGDVRSDFIRDGAIAHTSNSFIVELPNDLYDVTVTMGTLNDLDGLILRANGKTILQGGETSAEEYLQVSAQVEVIDGLLTFVVGNGGLLPNWAINGIDIRSATQVRPVVFDTSAGSVPADGLSTVAVTANSEAIAGELMTVSTTLGTIVTPDADAEAEGIQLLVGAGGTVTFEVRSPSRSGTPELRAITLDGLHQGTIEDEAFLSWFVPESRRFDFNHVNNASATEPSPTDVGAVGVTRLEIDFEEDGFGWVAPPSSFDSVAPERDPDPDEGLSLIASLEMHQDYAMGHLATGGRTFKVEARPDVRYDVRVYVGARFKDQSSRVQIEGVNAQQIVHTKATVYSVMTFLDGWDRNGDGYLELNFGAGGDLSPLWMVNGVEIVESSVGLAPEIPFQLSTESPSVPGIVEQLLDSELATIVDAAISALERTELTPVQQSRLDGVTVSIADIGLSGVVGLAGSKQIIVDDDAAGFGWSVGLETVDPAKIDLLTVVTHELGHVIGLPELDASLHPEQIMAGDIGPGERLSLLGEIDLFYADDGDLLTL